MFGKKQTVTPVKFQISDRNSISKSTKITGDIESDGDFRIDGTLEGTLKTNGRVIIGSEGFIKGSIEASNADVEGRFSGKLVVHNTLTVKATAHISGDVVIGKLSIEPGATFNTTCGMKGTVKELNQQKEQARLGEKTAS